MLPVLFQHSIIRSLPFYVSIGFLHSVHIKFMRFEHDLPILSKTVLHFEHDLYILKKTSLHFKQQVLIMTFLHLEHAL